MDVEGFNRNRKVLFFFSSHGRNQSVRMRCTYTALQHTHAHAQFIQEQTVCVLSQRHKPYVGSKNDGDPRAMGVRKRASAHGNSYAISTVRAGVKQTKASGRGSRKARNHVSKVPRVCN